MPNALPKHIKKSHSMVFARQSFTQREADLFALMLANMKPDQWDSGTPKYEFTSAQLTEWLGLDRRNISYHLKNTALRLAGKRVAISESNGDFCITPLFKRLKYENSVLTMIPNDELKSEYVEYSKGFALIDTMNYISLSGEYSKRLYEILSRFKGDRTKLPQFTLLDLKGLFGLLSENGAGSKQWKIKDEKKAYDKNSVFINRCIKASILEISNNPATKDEISFYEGRDGDLGFTANKAGRELVSIDFHYKWNVKKKMSFDDAKNVLAAHKKRVISGNAASLDEERQLLSALEIVIEYVENTMKKDATKFKEELGACSGRIEAMEAEEASQDELDDLMSLLL